MIESNYHPFGIPSDVAEEPCRLFHQDSPQNEPQAERLLKNRRFLLILSLGPIALIGWAIGFYSG